MRIASRFDDRFKTEKCPVCLNISQNFMDFGDCLGCLRCGCIFVPKFIRAELDIKALLEAQLKVEEDKKKEFVCECGKDCTNALGLFNHKKGSKCPLKKDSILLRKFS